MTEPASIRIIRAMWHKGRRQFVPWTGPEIDRRAGTSGNDRQNAVKSGILVVEKNKPTHATEVLIYSVTKCGENMLRAHELTERK